MKVLILSSYSGCCPDAIKKLIENKGIRGRIGSVIEYIENNAIEYNMETHNDKWYEYNKDELTCYNVTGGSVYFGYCSDLGKTVSVSVKEVDTSKKWYIRVFDGQEILTYVPEYKCADEELNYYEKVRKSEGK